MPQPYAEMLYKICLLESMENRHYFFHHFIVIITLFYEDLSPI